MFDEDALIIPGMVVVHDEGLRYQVEDIRLSTVDYETAHDIGSRVVNYTQLEAGAYPVGTKWSKDEVGFRRFFTPLSSKEDITKTLAINPLFYDALSGEFSLANCEEEHTLGRLAIACFQNGKITEQKAARNKIITALEYSPSWSPDTTVEAYTVETPVISDQSVKLSSVSLARTGKTGLSIMELAESADNNPRVIAIGDFGIIDGALNLISVANMRKFIASKAALLFA